MSNEATTADLNNTKCYCPECSDEQSKADAQAEATVPPETIWITGDPRNATEQVFTEKPRAESVEYILKSTHDAELDQLREMVRSRSSEIDALDAEVEKLRGDLQQATESAEKIKRRSKETERIARLHIGAAPGDVQLKFEQALVRMKIAGGAIDE